MVAGSHTAIAVDASAVVGGGVDAFVTVVAVVAYAGVGAADVDSCAMSWNFVVDVEIVANAVDFY